MPLQTLTCPDCNTTHRIDLPADTQAVIQHRPDGDIVRVTPRVMPIRRPVGEFNPGFSGLVDLSSGPSQA